MEEHDDSGIEINGSWNGTMLRPHSSHHIPSGSPPRLTDDKAGQEISNTERLLSNNDVTATTKVRMCSSDRSNLVTEISPRLMDDKSGLETSLGKQTLLTEDLLSVKNTDTARRNIEVSSSAVFDLSVIYIPNQHKPVCMLKSICKFAAA